MRDIVKEVVAEVSASSPDRKLEVETSGNLRGQRDWSRLAQVVANLVGNAVQHGELQKILKSMKDPEHDGNRDRRHLGLGLYIVDKIVLAHGGSLDVRSSDEMGTTFTVHLPRR